MFLMVNVALQANADVMTFGSGTYTINGGVPLTPDGSDWFSPGQTIVYTEGNMTMTTVTPGY